MNSTEIVGIGNSHKIFLHLIVVASTDMACDFSYIPRNSIRTDQNTLVSWTLVFLATSISLA